MLRMHTLVQWSAILKRNLQILALAQTQQASTSPRPIDVRISLKQMGHRQNTAQWMSTEYRDKSQSPILQRDGVREPPAGKRGTPVTSLGDIIQRLVCYGSI